MGRGDCGPISAVAGLAMTDFMFVRSLIDKLTVGWT